MGKKSAPRGRLRVATKTFLVRPAHGKCQLCGYDRYIGNLSFHHRDPATKSFNISMMILDYALKKLITEASKCILVCHNCHGEIHAGLITTDKVDKIPNLDFGRYKLPRDVLSWYKKRRIRRKRNGPGRA